MKTATILGLGLALALASFGGANAADMPRREVHAHVVHAHKAEPYKAHARRHHVRRHVVVIHRADVGVERGYTGLLPACDDPAVESRVSGGFAATEREYWGSGLALSPFARQREIGYRSWGASFIPRRFCTANVVTNDGRRRLVSYNIRENQGFGSLSWGVEWCVSGLDRHHSYAPSCKMARP